MTAPDCLFCKIVAGDVPATVVHRGERTVAFRDINPQAPVHILVIPREHLAGFGEVTDEQTELMGRLTRTVARVAAQEGIGASGYRCVVNSGVDAQQSVPHLHWHVLGGRPLGWPPG